MTKQLLCVIFLLNITCSAQSKEFYALNGYGNIGINYNMSRSNGIVIPPFCPTCLGLTDGSGLGANAGIGILVETKRTLFDRKFQYGAYLSYTNLFSEFENDKFFGNLISGNEMTSGNVNYNLQANFKSFDITPYIYLYPFREFNAAIKLGIGLSYCYTTDYNLSEKATDNNQHFPDGLNEHTYSGKDAPFTNFTFLYLPVGIKYDLLNIGNLTVSPEIQYSLGLSSLQAESKWKLDRLSGGVSLVYRFEKEEIKPVTPPSPKLPEPVKPVPVNSEITSSQDWTINGKKYINKDTIIVAVKETEYYEELPAIPLILFDSNSAVLEHNYDMNIDEINITDNPQAIQCRFLRDIPNINKTNKIIAINIFYTSDEDDDIGQRRLEYLKERLTAINVDYNEISFTVTKFDVNKLKYPELVQEYRGAYLVFKDSLRYNLKFLTNATKEYPSLLGTLNIKNKANFPVKDLKGKICLDKQKINDIKNEETDFILNLNNLSELPTNENKKLYTEYDITNSVSFSKKFTDSLNIIINLVKQPNQLNIKFGTEEDSTVCYEYIIALFEFDDTKIKYINAEAKDLLISALEENKRVEIYGMSDNLGTDDYNDNLINKRVSNLITKLNLKDKPINIVKAKTYQFNNEYPIGRIYNRSVLIRIYENNRAEFFKN